MSDPILLFLIADAIALLSLGAFAARIGAAQYNVLATVLCGVGVLLCLPPLLMHAEAAQRALPFGPPGLSLYFALDPLAACFLAIVLLAGTAIVAVQPMTARPAQLRMPAICIGGAMLALLAADGFSLALSLAVMAAATRVTRMGPMMVVPLLLLAAVCLLTPPGYAPRFDAIRAAPIDPNRATAAATLAIAACGGLILYQDEKRFPVRDALAAGILIPFGSYLLLRLAFDLAGNGAQAWWGSLLLLAGGAVAVVQAWRSAALPDIDAAIAALLQRQTGLAAIGIGLAVIARTADLPGAVTFALEATFVSALVAALAGTVTSLAAHSIGVSGGTYRLSRLGGLIHAMPGTSAALSAGLLAASALPPGLGFAGLWLAFQAILSAPRTGGVLPQIPVALVAASLAISAALATAASIRVVGIALLGRPRTPRGAGAAENPSRIRTTLLVLATASLVAGLLPGPLLRLLADPAIRAFTGLTPNPGLGVLSFTRSLPGYLALPLFALLGLTVGAVTMVHRWSARAGKTAGPWIGGMQPPVGLPFGDPAAQSAGAGFLPPLPHPHLPRLPRLRALSAPRVPAAGAGLWLMLAAFAALLLVLAVVE